VIETLRLTHFDTTACNVGVIRSVPSWPYSNVDFAYLAQLLKVLSWIFIIITVRAECLMIALYFLIVRKLIDAVYKIQVSIQ
jgi:hypothetical protein